MTQFLMLTRMRSRGTMPGRTSATSVESLRIDANKDRLAHEKVVTKSFQDLAAFLIYSNRNGIWIF
jgi:hypothetical protein